jgi:hypothetical protein
MSKKNEAACAGTWLQASGGETSTPSHVYFEGIAFPERKAGLVSTIVIGGSVGVGVGNAVAEGVGCRDVDDDGDVPQAAVQIDATQRARAPARIGSWEGNRRFIL